MSKKDDDIKRRIIAGSTPNKGHFVKGKSGNPRGRPKERKHKTSTDSSLRDQFLKAAEALMKLTENGRQIQIPVHEAIDRSEQLSAMKGSSHAQRNFIARYERYCRERSEEIEENHQQWHRYVSAYGLIVKDYADRGELFPDYFPSPGELNFPEGKFVTGWLGNDPYQGSVLRAFYTRLRDVWLLQSEKDRRHFGSKQELDQASGMIGLLINAFLPESAQLDEVSLMIRLGKQRVLKKRELQRQLTAAWAANGFSEGKDMRTWSLSDAERTQLLHRLKQRGLERQRQ